MNMKKKLAILLLILLAAAFIYSFFEQPIINTVEIHYSNYQHKLPFKGVYFTQDFIAYRGALNKSGLYVHEGDKVPRGMKIYQNINANQAGVIILGLDGYESKFNQNNIFSYDSKSIDKITINKKPGLKIVNNSDWYIYAIIDSKAEFKKYRNYDLVFDNNTYPSELVKYENVADTTYVLFEIKNDLNVMNLHRNINGYIIKNEYYGMVIPDDALTTYNGKDGVLIKSHGYAEFRKVDVLFKDDEKAVVKPSDTGKTVQEYDDVITNAKGLKDGTNVR